MAVYGPFGVARKLGATEYGGHEGLVQVGPDGPGGERVHEPTPSEALGMANRTDGADPEGVDPVTGLVPPSG